MLPNWAVNFVRGVFRGVEFESEVLFLKFLPGVGEIGPPTANSVIFIFQWNSAREWVLGWIILIATENDT